MWLPVSISVNCALIRMRSPIRRTLPSTMQRTFNSRATRLISTAIPRYRNEAERERTARRRQRDNSVMMSSVIPSLKYSCPGSPLMLVNGSTQIATRDGPMGGLGSTESDSVSIGSFGNPSEELSGSLFALTSNRGRTATDFDEIGVDGPVSG